MSSSQPTTKRLTVAALSALTVFAVSANIVFAALLRAAREFGVTPDVMANVSACQFTGFFLSSIIGGVLADRFGKKLVLQAGAVFLSVGAACWGLSPRVSLTFVAGFVMGVGGGILESMSSALLTDLFPDRKKFFLNLSQVAYCLGAIGGPALMGQLLPLGVSWRSFFFGTSVCGMALLVLFSASRFPETPQVLRREISSRRPAVLRPFVLVSCVVIFLYVFAEMGSVTFITVYLEQCLGSTEGWAIYAISIFWGAMVVGRLACACLPEGGAYEIAIAALLFAGGVCHLLQGLVTSWAWSVVLFGCTGLAFAGTWPLLVGAVATHTESSVSGAAIGLTVACGSVGCMVASPVLGPVFVGATPCRAFWMLAGTLFTASVLMAGLYFSRRRASRMPASGGVSERRRDDDTT
ncbi:MAG: MFS transporter [Lentisphaerae bacterium]|jgi:fucose permease|nr:MFS transporter [Lentisphaerota bacterium]MBT4816458.1 MFS transporter [Lentisphaerota bacterium]MBT5604405.1 MFS transporter [Lentisphaerota bacterium]MBT7059779.1 MFS transporter [Lentisphaerota bacterium]MBT7843905.1 MFS transporter [Lentisphaerota bacterium]